MKYNNEQKVKFTEDQLKEAYGSFYDSSNPDDYGYSTNFSIPNHHPEIVVDYSGPENSDNITHWRPHSLRFVNVTEKEEVELRLRDSITNLTSAYSNLLIKYTDVESENTALKLEVEKYREVIQHFIDKVDSGKARSVDSYNRFKQVLNQNP